MRWGSPSPISDSRRLDAPELDVVVGGLGLGYTARAALKHAAVRSLIVVEARRSDRMA